MKVVLFCGGLGMRIRDHDENLPKPMVRIGYRPVLWHVMKYYAHFGHKDFILCLGHGAQVIKEYFRNYDECLTNDFVLTEGGRRIELLRSDLEDWRITFADTGISSAIGQRLRIVEPYLEGERVFLANYSDGLTDLPLPTQLEHFGRRDGVASFLSVPPPVSYHFVGSRDDGRVTNILDAEQAGLRINGGYFIFRAEIFDYLRNGEDLVMEAFKQLLAQDQLLAYRYDGFWQSMDTFKDKQRLDEMYARGDAPWEVWKGAAAPESPIRLANRKRQTVGQA